MRQLASSSRPIFISLPKPLTVRQRWMRSDFNVMLLGELHRRAHVIEVGGVEAACDIGDVDRGHDALVVAEAPDAETLAHVAIQEGHQRLRHGRVHKVTKTGAIVKSEILALRARRINRRPYEVGKGGGADARANA